MIIEGLPLFFIEYAIGQRMRRGSISCWRNVHPALTGLGVSCVVVSLMLCLYYVVIIAWCMYYMFISFTKTLPWEISKCPQYAAYNVIAQNYTNWKKISPKSAITIGLKSQMDNFTNCCVHDPPSYYFYEKALRISASIEDGGSGVSGPLVGCLFFAWVVTYLCIVKGVKSSGKVCYTNGIALRSFHIQVPIAFNMVSTSKFHI